MDIQSQIKDSLSSTRIIYLILCLGLSTIIPALIFSNMFLFSSIISLPIIIIVVYWLLKYPWTVFLLIYIVNYYMLGVNRYVQIEGISVIIDVLFFIAGILILIQTALYRNIEWKRAIHILTIMMGIWVVYCLLELVNPTASAEAWVLSRNLIFNGLIITLITSLLCNRYQIVKLIIFCLSIFTLTAIVKTLIQKYNGFDSYEVVWLNAGGSRTHIIHSGIRYFSFFTDASNLGSNMGGASIIFGIYAFFVRSHVFKVYYIAIALLSVYCMFLSGTRGAMIIPLAGLALFTIVSKQTKSIIGGATLLLFVYAFFVFTMIGESNDAIRRMRSAFRPNTDASYNVRKQNQEKLGEYLKNRPFGEGVGLSDDGPGAKLSSRFATSIPTDSWYVKIWVETGVVGLVLYLGMVIIAIARGTWIIMFHIRDSELKGLLSGLLCAIFGMFLSAYGNSFWGQFPTTIIVFSGLSIILNGKYFDQEISNKQKQSLISHK